MRNLSPVVIVTLFFAICIAVPLGLYALLTRERRRNMRTIRIGAAGQGWRFRIRHWLGDPTAFRIDGRSPSGLYWILKTCGTSVSNPAWNAEMSLRIPRLAGKPDFALLPRDTHGTGTTGIRPRLSPETENRVAKFSGTLAGAIEFFESAQEFPLGLSSFDAAYSIVGIPGKIREGLVDSRIADKILRWPADAVAPRAVLAWRDPFGLHLTARLPGPGSWGTVTHFVDLAGDLAARLPVPEMLPAPAGFIDRLTARFMRT